MVKINLYTYADCLEGFNLYRSDQSLDELNSYLTERIRQDPLFKNNYYHTTVVVGYDEEKGVVYLSENFSIIFRKCRETSYAGHSWHSE